MNAFTPTTNTTFNSAFNQQTTPQPNNRMNVFSNNWGMNLPRYEAPQLKGRMQAERFQMAPGSEIFLPDADEDIIWWIRVNNAGEHIVIPFDVTMHQEPTPVDINSLVQRINNLEEQINNAKPNKSNAKRQRNNAEADTTTAE